VEIEVTVRKLKRYLFLVLGVALLGVGFISWRTYRWDQPWLEPIKGYDLIVIRFDGLAYRDKEFAQLRDAFLRPSDRTLFHEPILHGFRPSDLTYDERKWPSRYAWVGMIGYVEPSRQSDALQRIAKKLMLRSRKQVLG
jgi:hypothetical protein